MNKRKRDLTDNASPEAVISRCVLKPIGHVTSSAHLPSPLVNATLFPTGDLLIISTTNSLVQLLKEAVYCLNPISCYFETNSKDFHSSPQLLPLPPHQASSQSQGRGQEQPPSSPLLSFYEDDTSHHRHYILASVTGNLLFALTGADHRISKIEYQITFEDNEETVTALCCSDHLAVIGTTNNELYLIGRDYSQTFTSTAPLTPEEEDEEDGEESSSRGREGGDGNGLFTSTRVFCLKLRRQNLRTNLLSEWIETGTKLLGFGWSSDLAKAPQNGVIKLLSFHSSASVPSSGVSASSSSMLLSLNSTSVALWQLYETTQFTSVSSRGYGVGVGGLDEEGQERLFWEINLQLLLEADVGQQLASVITSASSVSHSQKIHRRFQFVDLSLLTACQDYRTESAPQLARKCVHVALLSVASPTSTTLPSNSHLLHPELWIHVLQLDLTKPLDLSLSSSLAAQQAVCQIKLRRRVAILSPSLVLSKHLSPRLLSGSQPHSIVAVWYDLPRAATPAATPSLHSIELIDLHHYASPLERSSPVEFNSSDLLNQANNASSDSTAYSDYFLLHDTAGTSNRSPTRAGSAGGGAAMAQKSNLCEGIGSDSGLLLSSVVSVESLRRSQHKEELTVSRKGLTVITTDGSIITCTPPEVSIVALYTTAPLSPAPSTDLMQILLNRCSGESTLDECYSALLVASSLLSDSPPSEGVFTSSSIERILRIASQASHQIIESNGVPDRSFSALPSIPSASGLLSSKIKQHERLLEVTSQILAFSPRTQDTSPFTPLTSILTANHNLLLGSLSLCSQLQEIRKRVETKQNLRNRFSTSSAASLAPINRGARLSTSIASSQIEGASGPSSMNEQSRDRLMLSGEEELMKLIQHGFHREVQSRERDRLFQMDYLQDGWSVMDIFFVQPSLFPRGMLTIVTGLLEQYRQITGHKLEKVSLSSGQATGGAADSLSLHQLLATSYCFCSLLLSIIQSPLSSAEAEKVSSTSGQKSRFDAENEWSAVSNSLSLVCREEIRKCLSISLECFQYAFDLISAESHESIDLIRRDWEGNRLYQLCSALLLGYEAQPPPLSSALRHALASSDSPLHAVNPIHLREDFHQAKQRSVGVLLSIRSHEEAYSLSVRFQCFVGIMNSVWSQSRLSTTSRAFSQRAKPAHFHLLLPQLHRQLADSSSELGVIDPFPTTSQLGTFCLEWLEKNGRYQEILDLGRHAPHHLQRFLQSRPYLAWIQNLVDGRYAEAAQTTSLYCLGEMVDPKTQLICSSAAQAMRAHESKPQSLQTTKTLLSVSKLCSWLEIKKQTESPHLAAESKEPVDRHSTAHDSWETANSSLLTLRAQQLIEEKRDPTIAPSSALWSANSFEHLPSLLKIAHRSLVTATAKEGLGSHELLLHKRDMRSSLLLIAKLLHMEFMRLSASPATVPPSAASHPLTLLTRYFTEFWQLVVAVDASQWIHLAAMNSSSSSSSGVSSAIYSENKMLHLLQQTVLYALLTEELWNNINRAERVMRGSSLLPASSSSSVQWAQECEKAVLFSLQILKTDPKVLDLFEWRRGEGEGEGADEGREIEMVQRQVRNMVSRCVQLAQTDSCTLSDESKAH